ncbi:MAG: tetratricopeptide repeat protein [Ignavibacteriales bacterium]|nr:tetratricopeptide repeat protein [Ignavibacteriales bacterium]
MKKIFYFLILIIMIGCSSNNDKKFYDEGLKLYNEKKYNEALNKFQQVLNENTSGEFREKSLMLIGTMYYMNQVPNVGQMESNRKAVDYFRKLYKEYPKSEDAPKALFLSGFILSNNLQKLDEAKLAYQTFLKEYPNHELVSAVKSELENLGKDPEQILQNKLSKK